MQPQVKNATPEEFDEWQQTELNWWADRQLSIVALMSVVQVVVFGFMLLSFSLINLYLS